MKKQDFNQKWIQRRLRITHLLAVWLVVGIGSVTSLSPSMGMIGIVKAAPVVQPSANPQKIRKISPTFDRLEGGAQVEIKGKNFTPDTVVVIGDAVATDTQIIRGKKIKFTVPLQKAPGVRTLSVWTSNGIAQMPFQIIPKKLDELADGEVTTIAGGIEYLGDGDNQRNAILNRPSCVATDSKGNLFITDTYSHRIRRIDAQTGIITTIAGTGRQGFSGDGGPALVAQLAYPLGLTVSSQGNVFVLDLGNQRVRRINLNTGIISTVAGNGKVGFSGDNGPAQSASLSVGGLSSNFQTGGGIGVDQAENLFIADIENHRIRRVDAESGIIKTIVGTAKVEFSGDGGLGTQADVFFPTNVAIDQNGNLFIADSGNNRIRRVDVGTGIITTVAGNGAPGSRGD
ncbi:MAG TPA: IPT/TIG domain-containing protein, partial [Acidobacteriota bacterium]|nr:IPT/TIG domain-containing protein [Acidobacteriota bacterium]